jgi:alkylhydroperoxidase family enzyme
MTKEISISSDRLEASRRELRAFGEHYGYDTTYMEVLMEDSPGAYLAFEAALGMGRYQKAAPIDALTIAKLAAIRAEDCGPCAELGVKMAREAGVPETVIRGALHGGQGLNAEQREVYDYAVAVATNGEMDPELLPRLQQRLGREAVAELALGIVATRLYPTMKRGLGLAKSCSLVPGLLS